MDFYKRVELVCKAVPYGKVITYGQAALLCGKPKNSRQVGFALNRKMPDDVPVHRVVNSQGYMSGAKAFETPDTQRHLLESEGVCFSDDNRINLKVYGWKNTLAEAETLIDLFEKDE